MKKKAVVVILLYISLTIFTSINLANSLRLDYNYEDIQLILNEDLKSNKSDLPGLAS